jgi:predicted ribosome quality control (RQC) complex YloA/Tae2 family protein
MLREDRLEIQLVSLLEAIRDPKKLLLSKLEAALRVGRPDSVVGRHREAVVKSLNRQLDRLLDMGDALYEDKLANYISAEKFEQKHQDLTTQISEIQARLARLHEAQDKQEQDKPEQQSKNPIANLYLQSSPNQKRTIISRLYKALWADGDQVEFRTA